MHKKSLFLIFISLSTLVAGLCSALKQEDSGILSDDECFALPAYSYSVSPTNEPKYNNLTYITNTDKETIATINQKGATFDRINVESTWSSYRGEKIKVAVIDTGCNLNHQEFNNMANPVVTWDVTKNSTDVTDNTGHGTDTAATIAASINSLGITGISPNIELYIVRAATSTYNSSKGAYEDGFTSANLKKALNYCLKEHVDVINMSVQGYSSAFSSSYFDDLYKKTYSVSAQASLYSYSLSSEINDCYNAGITIVAAAGNYNTSNKSYPAANDHIISVASSGLDTDNNYNTEIVTGYTRDKIKAGFSNYGDWIDVVAPGYVIAPGTSSNTGYVLQGGTSFSAPIVTGAVALYKSKYPSATPDQIETQLKSTCTAVDPSSFNNGYGSGQINVEAFLNNGAAESWVSATGMTLSDSSVAVNASKTLVPTFTPSNASRKTCYWSSSDTSVATVDANGVVNGLKLGTTTITATSIDGSFVDTCTLTVGDYIPVQEVILDVEDTQNIDSYDLFNIVAHVSPDNASNQNLKFELVNKTGAIEVDEYGCVLGCEKGIDVVKVSSEDNPSIYELITFSVDGAVPTQTVALNISSMTGGTSGSGSALTFNTDGFKVEFNKGYGTGDQIRNYSGTITISSTDKIIKSITYFIPESSYGGATVTTSTNGYSVNYITDSNRRVVVTGDNSNTVSIKAGSQMRISGIEIEYYTQGAAVRTLDSISVSGQKTSFVVGDSFSFGSGKVTANYTNETTADVTSLATITPPSLSTAGSKEVSVSYTENGITKGTSYYISVKTSGGGTGYYDSITATSDMALLGQLHDLTCTKHKTYNGYSDDLNTTNYFKTDPYNSNNSYLRDFYSGGQMNNTIVSSGTGGWNREHVWPKSLSNGLFEQSGAGADIQHLRPTIAQINNDRSSKKYAVITGSKTASSYSFNGTTYIGGYHTSLLFEPIDTKKGDVARIIMYLYMHYNTYKNFKKDDVTYATTNGNGSSSYFGTLNFTNVMDGANEAAAIETLLHWNLLDPVDDIETLRNDEAAKITGARNPFIDNENYANLIWGEDPTPTKTLTGISVSDDHRDFFVGDDFVKETVTATYSDGSHTEVTSSATFSGYNMSNSGTQTVSVSYTENDVTKDTTYNIQVNVPKVTNLELNKYTASLDVNGTSSTTLTASVTAQEGADQTVSWSIVDGSQYVSLSATTGTSITVTGLEAGSATVRATAGDCYKDCVIEVTDSTPVLVQSITISGSNTLVEGSSTKLTAAVLPTNATNKEVTWSSSNSNITVSQDGTVRAPNGTHGQTTTITATAKDEGRVSETFEITIDENVTVTSIEITYSGLDGEAKVSFARYPSGTELDAKVIAHLSNGGTQDVTSSATKNFKVNYLKLGYQTITASYPGLSQVSLRVFVSNKGSSEYVGVTSKVTRAGGSFNATPEMQAQAWAEYFISVTGGGTNDGPCKLPEGQRAAALEEVWGGLSDEYGWMAAASKDEFFGSTTNSKIIEARDHYKYIVKTYPSLDNFVKNSSNIVLSVANTNSALERFRDVSIIVAVFLVIAGGAALIVYFTFRKRKTR